MYYLGQCVYFSDINFPIELLYFTAGRDHKDDRIWLYISTNENPQQKGLSREKCSFLFIKQLGLFLIVSGFRSLKRLVKIRMEIKRTDEMVD